ncbi:MULTISPECIES: PLP-dependent aminotransferase family protein [Butyricimonas]|jgi:2-aminoadipate transaminase|uniref:PLP-dependent aminotransferase family protein n=1 Tax=Butyricimonas virosa TaxID=544645 RepID=A0A415QAX8_9BACT|nr:MULTISPECIES: PLP-dependent aminotransferase family protein [Butyricimonas]MBR5462372.1 PLP-dependent aminotransferase family protein [Butyricimonas sp.]RGV30840.1 PLP-dependent aminotransferase family protein [Butyricimonas virosa]RHM38820.1 PLP-dependent aminotransferase family protein [Butyricimonas virosa]HAM85274.1 aminotransferase [Butyricimonas sp.]HCH89845.1 aminotransferase [Butyricimonas sp.]
MVSDYKEILSDSAKGMKRSAIRELLKLTQKPEIISFAGGLPAKESFPLEQLQEICAEVIATDGAAACQYGSTEGVPELLEILAQRYRDQGLSYVTKENITIITSSQQGLDTVGKIFLNRGDKYICELPSYLGALGAFNSYGGVGVGIPQDEQGMSAVELEKTLAEMKAKGEKPKFIYLIPDFQNPAGMTMPEARRIEILNIAKKHEIMIIEDSPYRELRFSGKPQRMLYDLDNGEGNVITLGTFSKIFMPGFRMGWVLAHPMVIDNFVKAKQSTDLCTSAFLQKITVKFFQKNYFDANVKNIVDMYRGKLEAMLGAFEKYMPEGVTWTRPEGGLFLFLTLPEGYDAEELFQIAIEKNVAFVLGTVFFVNGGGKNTMRINFSYMSEEMNIEGVKRLADAIKELYARKK